MSAFTGWPPEAIGWFAGLEADNSKEYFAGTRQVYEAAVRGPLLALLDEIRTARGFDEPKVFRPHRDVRFSADKSPYKTQASAGFLDDKGLVWYLEVSADGLFAASGYHMMAKDQLTRFRAAVAADDTGPALVAAVGTVEAAGEVAIHGEALKVAPRGYPRDHPRVRLLRHTGLTAGTDLSPGPVLHSAAAKDHVLAAWDAAAPLHAWLRRHVGPSSLPPPAGPGR